MRMINVTPYAIDYPLLLNDSDYQGLVRQKQRGWTFSMTREECLAKLHYLRDGYQQNKISREQYLQKEKQLILNWWKKDVAQYNFSR